MSKSIEKIVEEKLEEIQSNSENLNFSELDKLIGDFIAYLRNDLKFKIKRQLGFYIDNDYEIYMDNIFAWVNKDGGLDMKTYRFYHQ